LKRLPRDREDYIPSILPGQLQDFILGEGQRIQGNAVSVVLSPLEKVLNSQMFEIWNEDLLHRGALDRHAFVLEEVAQMVDGDRLVRRQVEAALG